VHNSGTHTSTLRRLLTDCGVTLLAKMHTSSPAIPRTRLPQRCEGRLLIGARMLAKTTPPSSSVMMISQCGPAQCDYCGPFTLRPSHHLFLLPSAPCAVEAFPYIFLLCLSAAPTRYPTHARVRTCARTHAHTHTHTHTLHTHTQLVAETADTVTKVLVGQRFDQGACDHATRRHVAVRWWVWICWWCRRDEQHGRAAQQARQSSSQTRRVS
jgi:hypothetical protein